MKPTIRVFGHYGDGKIVRAALGFDNEKDRGLVETNAVKILGDKAITRAFAGRANLMFIVEGLRLVVIDRTKPQMFLADLRVTGLDRSETVIPDGIAVTGDTTFVTTTAGRVLAFGAP